MNAVSDDFVSLGAVSLGAIVSVAATFAFLAAAPHAPPAPLLEAPQPVAAPDIVPELNLPEPPEMVVPMIPPASTPQGPVADFAIIWDLREELEPTGNFAVIRDVRVAFPGVVDFALLWHHEWPRLRSSEPIRPESVFYTPPVPRR